ncbi:MAG: peptidylprolyl isomerase [Actinobacteria bacterium]|nr:MAG: peptidylprolyl isomerase [Actinomycetota bacterium]
MASNQRERQLAREKYERQQERRAVSSKRRGRGQKIIAAAVVLVLVAGSLAYVFISQINKSEPVVDGAAAASALASAMASAAPETLACTPAVAARPDNLTWTTAPAASLLASKPAKITFTTNCGDIVIETLPDQAPLTVASEIFLVEQGFYDSVACHRLTTAGIFVLQCGDPKGDGTGGPGYQVPDENLPGEGAANYPAGSVAMANAGPGTSGSQFFLVYDDTTLPSGYTIWGTITSGLELLRRVAAAGVAGGGSDGAPTQSITIETATAQAG